MRYRWSGLLAALLMAVMVVGCSEDVAEEDDESLVPEEGQEYVSSVQRELSPDVADGDYATLVGSINEFACNAYAELADSEGDLFFSPTSISMALAMTYAGAKGQTAQQMATALSYELEGDTLHAAFDKLDLELASRGEGLEEDEGTGFKLTVVNQIWGQAGVTWLDSFLDTLAFYYGAGLVTLDFATAAEEARVAINEWVEEMTGGKIVDLLPEGSLVSDTKLVLTNAIYFKATWYHEFDTDDTEDGVFTTPDGEVTVPMMTQQDTFGYFQGKKYQAVRLPYVGNEVSMVVLVPDEGSFDKFEKDLDSAVIDEAVSGMTSTEVLLAMPRFELASQIPFKAVLKSLKMVVPFNGGADFSGITEELTLFIDEVYHQAVVTVDEEGTEAAAATAVVMVPTSIPPDPVEVTIDRPFVFVIQDMSGAILFMGRVLDPS